MSEVERYWIDPSRLVQEGWHQDDTCVVKDWAYDRVVAERDALQQRLTAADERADRLASLTNDDLIAIARTAALNSVDRYNYMPCIPEEAFAWKPHYWVIEAMRAALKPTEGGGDDA